MQVDGQSDIFILGEMKPFYSGPFFFFFKQSSTSLFPVFSLFVLYIFIYFLSVYCCLSFFSFIFIYFILFFPNLTFFSFLSDLSFIFSFF